MTKIVLVLFLLCVTASAQIIKGPSTSKALMGSVEMTRTNDTAAYVVGDLWSTNSNAADCYPMMFANCVPTSGSGVISYVRVTSNNKLCTIPFKLVLYSTTNLTLQTDSAGFAPTYTNDVYRMGSVDVPNLAPYSGAGTDFSKGENIDSRLVFNTGRAHLEKNLYGYLVCAGGYTPVAGEKITVKIKVIPLQ